MLNLVWGEDTLYCMWMLPTVSASFLIVFLRVLCERLKIPLKQGVNYFCPFAKTVIWTTRDILAKAVRNPSSLNLQQRYLLSPPEIHDKSKCVDAIN